MAKRITAIPATVRRYSAAPTASVEKRRVAGYARVSTDREEQQTSFAAQLDYYKSYIASREDWEFAGMYSDEGLSATSTTHREGFKQMVQDALDGKFSLIITKSVSRFARNTVDSLTTVRKLKEKGVEVYFEKENIWTLDAKGELLITIMSSLSQEESRSISENTTWGRRKQFSDGKASIAFGNFLGYDRGPDGAFVINEEQARIVRMIYRLFLSGLSFGAIARELTAKGIKTPMGKDTWSVSTVRSILQNEKMKGDALLQKKYTPDFLTKKQVKNHGEVPQYYVEGHHPAIIEPRTFDLVQEEIKRRYSTGHGYSGVSPFSSKIVCGECGAFYGSKVLHSTDKYKKTIYRCNRKYKKGNQNKCGTPNITEEEIKAAFVAALDRLLGDKDAVIANMESLKAEVSDTSVLEAERDAVAGEMQMLAEMTRNAIEENASRAIDQTEYNERYDSLVARYEQKKEQFDRTEEQITSIQAKGKAIEDFIDKLRSIETAPSDFDVELWCGIVESMTVYTDRKVVTFKGGLTVTV